MCCRSEHCLFVSNTEVKWLDLPILNEEIQAIILYVRHTSTEI
ncbi:rCG63693 [Rattus norvegicus]|uniref:RCG63693 n=1 Tax=Rattus norvegicus TaxID=10116 RepID=A6HRN7_RAT|nr:rCG63693 [Rattus norvegicus]